MKIKELCAVTNVRKETIHYYTRENLLPKLVKTSSTQAQYGQAHIDRIKLIKGLQERLFMPLSAIKKLIRTYEEKGLNPDQALMEKITYFDPLSQLMEEEVQGEDAFAQTTGVAPERLEYLEKKEFFRPRKENGEKVYSYNDLSIGRIMGELRRKGFSIEKGFSQDIALEIKALVDPIVTLSMEELLRVARQSDDAQKMVAQKEKYIHAVALLIQHFFIQAGRSFPVEDMKEE